MTQAPVGQMPGAAPAHEEVVRRLRAVPPPPAQKRSLVARRPGVAAVVAAVASRVLVFAVAFVSSYYWGSRLRSRQPAPAADVLVDRHPLGFFLSAWRHWDTVWFTKIAENGYGKHATAFFPLYPALMRVVGPAVGGRTTVAGIIVSVACYAATLVILYRLVRDEFGASTAAWTVILLSFASTSFFFQAVYSESLFLLLTVASFAAGRRGHWVVAGLVGGLAALTRSAGVLLLVPLAWMWIEQYRGGLRLPGAVPAQPPLARGRPRLTSLAALLFVPAGLAVYMAYLRARFGDPLEFVVAEKHWHRRLRLPFASVWDGALAAWRSLRQIAADPSVYSRLERLPFRDQWVTMGNLTAFLALLFAVALLVACWRRLPSAYTVFAVVSLLLPLAYPTRGTPLLSFPRFVLVDFPLFVVLALLVERRPVARWALAGVLAAGLVLLTVVFANGMWVA